jgi:predicted DNA-binding ribbon-helix-helix protein
MQGHSPFRKASPASWKPNLRRCLLVPSRLVNRNVTASRGRTSMRLEPELWEALHEICERERLTIGEVVRRIEKRGHPGGRTSAVRVHVLEYFRSAATEAGHRAASHGALAAAGTAAASAHSPGPAEAQPVAAASASGPV